ncbi:MAG: EAL domain-containing protein [Glaciecola sp.]|jgi:predicted signal transduction protein with EAL and GGDEF domain|nr:EAL domain-containing protein [Glaciecola sp.]MDG1469258.1 EAL domain-containing protein [Glaciecola sp.]MDG1922806.1 EAL domain-containing protein [Glaciecola sp.]
MISSPMCGYMMHNMGIMVVAEGIEDVRQFNWLRDMKCDKAQGFYIAKPIPEYELMKTLPSMVKDNVWQGSYANRVADNDKTGHQQLSNF